MIGLALGAYSGGPRSARASAPELRRYPYLTDVVGGSATVNWGTDRTVTASTVTYGPAGGSCTENAASATPTEIMVRAVPQYQWRATISVQPGTRYCYRVHAGPGNAIDLLGPDPSPEFSSALAAGSNEPYSFAVLGDWGHTGGDGTNPHQANVLAQLAQSGVQFALSTGDIAYPGGSDDNYGDLVQVGQTLSTVFGADFWKAPGAGIPLFPVTGNHGFNDTFLRTWPQATAALESNGRYQLDTFCCTNGTASAAYPSAWYAFTAGNARFYVLTAAWDDNNVGTADEFKNDYDNHWTPTSPEYQWLRNDLANHPAPALKFAFFHYPMYSAAGTSDSDTYLQGAGSLEGLLNQFGVDIGFSGHDHHYVRNVAPPGGVITYVTGGGGAMLNTVDVCDAPIAYAVGWNPAGNRGSSCGAPVPDDSSRVYHFLKVSVQGGQVTVTPTDEQGRTFDTQTYSLGGPVDTTPPTTPSGLTASATDSGVALAWDPSSDDVGVHDYEVVRNGSPLTTVVGATTYLDTSVTAGATYAYRVRARDAAGNESELSTEASVTVASTPTTTSTTSTTTPTTTTTITPGTTTTTAPPVVLAETITPEGKPAGGSPRGTALTGSPTGVLIISGVGTLGAGLVLTGTARRLCRYRPLHRRRRRFSRLTIR